MPRRKNQCTDLARPDPTATATAESLSLPAAGLSGQQLNRWAELVATGEAGFPDNLLKADEAALCRQVRQRRRDRLIRFVARAIAREIWRELQTIEEKFHAKENV